MTHFSHQGKKINRSSLLSHETNSRYKKRALEAYEYLISSDPLSYTVIIKRFFRDEYLNFELDRPENEIWL